MERPGDLPTWRVVLAFVAAPVPAVLALAFMAMGSDPEGRTHRFVAIAGLGLFFGAYPPVFLLGLPAYFLLRRRLRPTVLTCGLAGACVAALPWLVLNLLFVNQYSFDGGRVTAEHGHRTMAGWLDLAAATGWVALAGAFTGVVFWLIAAAGAASAKPPAEEAF